MSVIANLSVNLSGNTADLDKAFDKAAAAVKAFGKKEQEAAMRLPAKERNKLYRQMLEDEEAVHARSYAGFKKRLKDEEKAAKDHAKELEKAARDAAKHREKMAAMLGTMFGQVAEGLTSGTLSGVVKAFTSMGTAAATLIGGPIAGGIVGALGSVAGGIVGALSGIASRALGAVTGAVSGVLGTVTRAVTSAFDYAYAQIGKGLTQLADMAKGAKVLGVTTQEVAALQRAADLTGLKDITGTLQQFNVMMAEARFGTGAALLPMRMLGLRAKELVDLPLETKLGVLADRLNNLTNAGDKARLANMLGLGDLMPMLEKGGAGLRKVREEAMSLGAGVGAQQALEAQRAWNGYDAAVKQLWQTLASAFAPAVKSVGQYLARLATNVAKWASENSGWITAMANSAGALLNAVIGAGSRIADAAAGMLGLKGKTEGGGDAFSQFSEKVTRWFYAGEWAFQNFERVAKLGFDWGKLKATEFGNVMLHIFTTVIPKGFGVMLERFTDAMKATFDILEKMRTDPLAAMGVGLEAINEGARKRDEALKGIWDRPMTMQEKAARKRLEFAMRQAGESLVEHVKERIKNALDNIGKGPGGGPGGGAGLTPPGPGNINPLPMKVGAMELGSKEAFSVLYGTEDRQAKALNVANQQLQELRKQNELLREVARQARGGVRVRRAEL